MKNKSEAKGDKMTRTEKLELENLVLKNILDCISESLDELKSADYDKDGYILFAGRVTAHIEKYPDCAKFAFDNGYTLDYRNSAFFKNQPDGLPVVLYPVSAGKRKTK